MSVTIGAPRMRRVAGRVMPALALAAAVALGSGACTPDDQETRTLDVQGEQTRAQLPPEVVEALDSGTVAFRAHRFEDALVHYQKATELAPDHAAGFFGISMTQEALGNPEAAEAAMDKVHELVPGATLLHPDDTVEGGEGTEP